MPAWPLVRRWDGPRGACSAQAATPRSPAGAEALPPPNSSSSRTTAPPPAAASSRESRRTACCGSAATASPLPQWRSSSPSETGSAPSAASASPRMTSSQSSSTPSPSAAGRGPWGLEPALPCPPRVSCYRRGGAARRGAAQQAAGRRPRSPGLSWGRELRWLWQAFPEAASLARVCERAVQPLSHSLRLPALPQPPSHRPNFAPCPAEW